MSAQALANRLNFLREFSPPQRNRSGRKPPHLAGQRTGPRVLARSADSCGAILGPRAWIRGREAEAPADSDFRRGWHRGCSAGAGAGPRFERTDPLDLRGLAGSTAAGAISVRRHFQRGRRDPADSRVGIRLVPFHALSQDRWRKCRRWWRPPAPISNTCGSPAKHWPRRAISSIRPPTISGPPSSAKPSSALRCSTRPNAGSLVGEDLLRQNYPLIYEVGKGSAREPRLIDMRWGKRGNPLVTLVGKGVCFDTGGLDIKPWQRHDPHEEGHGRRGAGAGVGAHAHGRGRARAASPADSRRRELACRAARTARATCCVRARA